MALSKGLSKYYFSIFCNTDPLLSLSFGTLYWKSSQQLSDGNKQAKKHIQYITHHTPDFCNYYTNLL